jgi:hypothetical protein
MNSLEKAFWNTSGENISILMPIQKIDAEKRIVSGWATTDVVEPLMISYTGPGLVHAFGRQSRVDHETTVACCCCAKLLRGSSQVN